MEEKETQESKRERKTANTEKAFKAVSALLIGLLAAAVLLYLVFAFYYRSHFLPKTTINGIPVDGQTVSIVEDEIAEQVKGYTLTLRTNSGETETITGDAILIKPEFHGELEELLKGQKPFLWIRSLFTGRDESVGTMVDFNESMLADELASLSLMAPEHQIPPTNAHVSDYTEEGFSVVPEDPGSTVDFEKLSIAATEAVATLSPELDLTAAGCYVLPTITSEDPALAALAAELNRYTSHTIRYDMEEDSRTIPGEVIASWLAVDENGNVSVDETAVADYVKELAAETDTYGVPRDFKTSSGNTITFQSVYYGWKIDKEAETAQLVADVQSTADVEREPIYEYRGASRGERDYGDTYVEVNLSAQHMYCYKDGALALDASCVTGCVGKGTITHVGLYSIYSKETDRDLVGENYRSHVNYWMPFNAGEGLHDATWRSSFGGSIYLTSGSHGCVNLANSVAGELYDLVEVGTPVFVYRMDATATASEAQIASMAVSAINSVGGVVTLASEPAIVKARNFYNYLSAENKGLVTNYDLLVAYEAQLAGVKAQISAAQAAAIAAQAAVIGNE